MVSKNTKFSTVTVRILKFFFLIFILSVSTGISHTAFAQEPDQKVVRAGWYESSFCYRDQFGRRSGIDYEYQHKISAYTGWTYEYVEDSWSNLLQMLINGEIDLLSDVSYTEERTAFMSFPDLPMGAEAYYIYIAADNSDITAQDLTSFNGKRIGVNRGSVQEGFLNDWAERNNITIEAVPLVVGEAESLDMLISGELDGYATIYTMGAEQNIIPLCRIGESYYYYAVNKDRPDLLAELNMALAGINKRKLGGFGGQAVCFMAEEAVAQAFPQPVQALLVPQEFPPPRLLPTRHPGCGAYCRRWRRCRFPPAASSPRCVRRSRMYRPNFRRLR